MRVPALDEHGGKPAVPFLVGVLTLLAGIAIAAYGLSRGSLLLGFVGFVLLLGALAILQARVVKTLKLNQPRIKASANPASSMKDEPVRKDWT